MTSWAEFAAAAPEFAARVRERFDTGTHKTMATLRRDGSPRISGTEAVVEDGELRLGMMPGSVKLADVRRDPRLALHSPTVETGQNDPSTWRGDAKVAGSAVSISGDDALTGDRSPGENATGQCFGLDIDEVVLTYVGTPADHLVIESWHPKTGWRRRTRT